MQLAPIVLFVYNRPWHTLQTLNALALNPLFDQSVLFIYADGSKNHETAEGLENIQKTRELINSGQWGNNVTVIESDVNKGLANSIITGVTDVVNKYGKIIVMEDDLVTHSFFLMYMNEYLDLYKNDEEVISIHGYMYPIKEKLKHPFFLKGADCWGWATWKRGWDLFENNAELLLDKLVQQSLTYEFDFNDSYGYTSLLKAQVDKQVDSWAIRWYASAFLLNKLTLYPPVSLVHNIGLDGSGTHKDQQSNNTFNEFTFKAFEIIKVDLLEDKKVKKYIEKFFRGDNSILNKLLGKLKQLFSR